MTTGEATSRWKRAGDTTAGVRASIRALRCLISSHAPGQQQRFEPFFCRREFVPLDGARRIHVLWAYLGALADKGAGPDPLVLGKAWTVLSGPLIQGVEVGALAAA